MSPTYFEDRAAYEERYDNTTVELCRIRERLVLNAFGERPPLDSHGEADPATGYYQYSIFYFQFVELLAGERWQERAATIEKWMAEDEAKDRRLVSAQPDTTPYCRSCGEDMQIGHKSYLRRERSNTKTDADDILFMFECKPCNKRMASWQDGTKWEPQQIRCEQCNVPVDETNTVKDSVITSAYTCSNCGHNYKNVWKLGAKTETPPDPHYKLDRRRFCFDGAIGQKFLERKAHIEHIGELLEQGRQGASAGGEAIDPVAEAVKEIKKLKVAQVADILAADVAKSGYTEFKLGEPQSGRELAVPFSCLDHQPERGDYDSRTSLKKLITTALADTNWQLMSDGVNYRLGYLSGRLRAYENDEELRKLVEKQLKSGARKQPATKPVPPAAEPPPPESPTAPKPRRGRPQRTIRVRGILHPNLHILIPPRESKNPAPQRQQRQKKKPQNYGEDG